MPNRLAGETSPYLLQHADNPVDWYPWGEEALALARQSGKPILLSIGYSACHWCHVMAHESFENAAVAEVMNRLFVNIKVDREERPDLDQIYQVAHQMLARQNGGWPLTLFLAPSGEPYFSGTYFPREPRYRMPGFIDICEWAARLWQEKRADITVQNERLRTALAAMAPPPGGLVEDLDARPLQLLVQALTRSYDADNGGFGQAPKFPHQSDLALLLQYPQSRPLALESLRKMAQGGIYDHIGGGFCRYSVDERWEIPHFEKMLYDNGLLLGLYADAWAITGEPLFARVVEQTAGWVMREMQSPQGAYYSSLDADAEGHEGRYYVWQADEVRALLSEAEWNMAAAYWGLDGAPNFEGQYWHLRALHVLPPTQEAQLENVRQKLFAAREKRVRPGRDEKILTGWNALMISGMLRAARIFERTEWHDSARRALNFIQSQLWCAVPGGGRLLATSKDGRAHLNAYLDDYAFMLAALLEAMQAEYRNDDLNFAQQLAARLLDDFEDRINGGFFFTSHDHESLIQRPKPGHENPLPSGNGMAALCLQRLGHLLGEPVYLTAAERTLAHFSTQFFDRPEGCATMMMALSEWLLPPTLVILRGPAEQLRPWQTALVRAAAPATLGVALANGMKDLPESMAMKESDTVSAWVCSGTTCRPPVQALAGLQNLLGGDITQQRAAMLTA